MTRKAEHVGFWGSLLGFALSGFKTGWGATFGPVSGAIGHFGTGYDALDKGYKAIKQDSFIQKMKDQVDPDSKNPDKEK